MWGAFFGLFVALDIWRLILYNVKMMGTKSVICYEKEWMGR